MSTHDHEFTKKSLDSSEDTQDDVSSDTPRAKKKRRTSAGSKLRGSSGTTKKKQSTERSATDVPTSADAETYILPASRKKDIDDDLRHIYSDTDGTLPNMTTFETKSSGGVLRAMTFLIASLLFLAGVAWFGFFTFQPQARFSERDVIVAVNGPDAIQIGDEVRYRIKYTNDQSVPLTQSSLQVRYPAGFVFVSSSIPATSDSNDTWELGAIDAGENDTIEIVGKLYGDINTEQSLRVFFNYTPANFSSEFQKVESIRTVFDDSAVQVSLSGPDTVSLQSPVTWRITVDGLRTDESAQVELVLPDGYTLTQTNPAIDPQTPRRWDVVGTTEPLVFDVTGMFATEETARFAVQVRLPIVDPDNQVALETVLVATASTTVAVTDTTVVTNLLINGVMGDFALSAGDTLNSTLVVQNSGDATMEDVVVRFVIDAPSDGTRTIFDWSNLVDAADGVIAAEQRTPTVRRATIVWSSAQLPALRSLAPGAEVVIPFALPMLTAEQADLTQFEAYTIQTSGDIQYTTRENRETMSTNPITVTVNSDLRFSTQHTYAPDADGEVHRVVYILENSFHGLKDIRVTSDVYGTINTDDIITGGGTATYNAQTGTLTWSIDQMPLGLDILPLEYLVRLDTDNPTQTNLTSKVRIQAIDVITGNTITIVGSEILLNTEDIPEISA